MPDYVRIEVTSLVIAILLLTFKVVVTLTHGVTVTTRKTELLVTVIQLVLVVLPFALLGSGVIKAVDISYSETAIVVIDATSILSIILIYGAISFVVLKAIFHLRQDKKQRAAVSQTTTGNLSSFESYCIGGSIRSIVSYYGKIMEEKETYSFESSGREVKPSQIEACGFLFVTGNRLVRVRDIALAYMHSYLPQIVLDQINLSYTAWFVDGHHLTHGQHVWLDLGQYQDKTRTLERNLGSSVSKPNAV